MATTITFLGHSGFLLSDGSDTVCIDPFLSGNELATHTPDDIDCSYLALTHGHADHVGDTEEILKKTGATLISSFEICNFFGGKGFEKIEPGNPGGTVKTNFGSVTFTHAFHSSSYEGQYMGMPMGLVVKIGGMTFHHLGDTGLFTDLRMYGEIYKPDVVAVPVGDRFTMDSRLGSKAAEWTGAKVAIPIHYKTFGLLAQDISGFTPKGVEVKELAPGESYTYGA